MQFDMSLEGADTIGASDDGLSDQKAYGFNGELMKRGRASEFLDGYFRDLPATGFRTVKMLKTDDLLRSKRMPSQTRDTPPTSNSFPEGFLGVSSLPKPDGLLNIPDSVQTTAFPSFQSLHTRVAGLSSSRLNGNIHGVAVGFGGPFTPAQMLELEHQILMFKRLDAGAPVPPNLLFTIRKTLVPSPPSAYSAASLAPHHASWGSVLLPFSGNGDPEPGRCRRTDGKKWRCAREAVTDQKYCERHLNRGRHRSSRKTVEGQTGHTTSRKGAAYARMAFPAASSPSLSPASDSLSMTQPQDKSSNASAEPTSSGANFSRFSITKSNSKVPMPNLSGSSFPCSENLETGSLSAAKQQFLYQHSSRTETGFNSSDPLLYNAQSNSYLQSRNSGLCQDLKTRAPQHAQCFRHSIHDRPKIDGVQPEATLLATSMHAATLGLSSSLSSPLSEQLALSPLKLMREVHPIQMGLSVGDGDCSSQKQTNWGLWETPLGGPLAEVLNSRDATVNSSMEAKNSSALHLIAQGWDAISPLESSPTGVLQKTAFGTLSSSSAGSSPTPETSKVNEDCPADDPLFPCLGILQPRVQPS